MRHSDNVAKPAELAMEEHGFDFWNPSPRSNFRMSHFVSPTKSKNYLETSDVKRLQKPDMTTEWDPCFATIYDGGDDDCNIDSNLCVNCGIFVTKHTFTQTKINTATLRVTEFSAVRNVIYKCCPKSNSGKEYLNFSHKMPKMELMQN